MKKITRITSFALAAVLGASAVFSNCAEVSAFANSTVYTAAGYSQKEIELIEKLKKYLQNYETKPIDISEYNISYDRFEHLYGSLVFNEPSLFYVSPVSAYLDYETKAHILSFSPVYNFTYIRTESIKRQLDEYIEELMSQIHDDWSDAEKALFVHDYIATHAVYYEGSNVYAGRNIYDLFMKETAVCVGYAESFQYVMDKLGIPCINITNDDHIWNMVQLDSNWYHLDVTWDDSLDASPNFVFHRMMLLSEYGLDDTEPVHDPWDYGMIADSNKYDDFFWQESCSAMVYLDGYWYYSTIDGICRYSFETDTAQLVCRIKDGWKAEGGIRWLFSFAKVQEYGGKIYFNTPYKIYSFSPDTNDVSLICTPKLKNGYQIYDFVIEGGQITVYSSDDINDMDKEISHETVKITAETAAKPKPKKEVSEKTDANAPIAVKNDGKITITWNEDPNAEQYIVYRYDKGTKKIVQLGTTVDDSFTFAKTEKDDNCLYAVKTRTADGLSDYSPWVALQ